MPRTGSCPAAVERNGFTGAVLTVDSDFIQRDTLSCKLCSRTSAGSLTQREVSVHAAAACSQAVQEENNLPAELSFLRGGARNELIRK